MTTESIRKWLKKHSKLLSFIFAVGISVSIYIFRESILQLGQYSYIGLFLLSIFGSATIFLPTPLFLAAAAASTFLNPLFVAVVSSLGSAVGEMTGYLLGYGSEEVIDDQKGVKKVKGWMEKYGLWTLFVLSAIPNPLFDIAGIIAGATNIPIKKFFVVVWLGKLIKFTVIAFVGASASSLINSYL